MFHQTFVNTQAQTRRPWTVAASLALQAAVVVLLLILPLMHIEKLIAPEPTPVWLPLVSLAPPPEPKVKPTLQAAAIRPRRVASHLLFAPAHIPAHIDMAPDSPELPDFAIPVQAGGAFSAIGSAISVAPPPQQPAPVPTLRASAPAMPVHISMGVESARLLFGPKPAYPPLARTARVQGIVKVEAIIARDGTIKNLHVVSGPPLLVAVAIEAVRQWRYQPTLLNGEPVEVITEIDVNFTLN